VDSTITEAKTLQELAKANNLTIPAATDSLIVAAEEQNKENQTERAFVLADEAVLQIHLSILQQENINLNANKKEVESDLAKSKESLDIYRNFLKELNNTPKEQVVN
jgi:hypothetical protein